MELLPFLPMPVSSEITAVVSASTHLPTITENNNMNSATNHNTAIHKCTDSRITKKIHYVPLISSQHTALCQYMIN